MASFFRNRDYPSNVIQRAQERVSAIPRNALISERSDVPDAQPTIPLVLTYHKRIDQKHHDQKLPFATR